MITFRRSMILFGAVALAGGLVLAGCGRGNRGSAGGSIQIKGSDTMVNLAQSWSENFMKEHPEIPIAVTGGGSGTGIAALIGKTTDIAASSREMKQEEIDLAKRNGVNTKEIEVAYDAIVVVVNPANPVKKLTIDQLSDIYTGKITNWKQVGGIDQPMVVLSREKNSGTHIFFLEHILRKGNAKGPEEYALTVQMLPSSQAIASQVETNANTIGYFGLGYLNKQKQHDVLVAKDANSPYIEPTPENALSGKYPVSRPLYLYTNGEPTGRIKEFVDYTLSPEGQKIVEKEGFVPLKGIR